MHIKIQQKCFEPGVANFWPNGIILSQSEQTCVGLTRMILRRRRCKSLKGQAFHLR